MTNSKEKQILQEYVKTVKLTKLSDIAIIQSIYGTNDINNLVITEGVLQNVVSFVKKNKNKAISLIKKSVPMAALLLLPMISQGQDVSSLLNRQDAEKVVTLLAKATQGDLKIDASGEVYSSSDIKNMMNTANDSTVYSTLGNILKYSIADSDKINRIAGGKMALDSDGIVFLGDLITSSSPELKNVPKEDFYDLGKAYMNGDLEKGIFNFKGKSYKVDLTPTVKVPSNFKGLSFKEHSEVVKDYIGKLVDLGSSDVKMYKIRKGGSYLGIDKDTEINLRVNGDFENSITKSLGLDSSTLTIEEFVDALDKLLDNYNFSLDSSNPYGGVNPEIWRNTYDENGEYKKVKEIDVYIKTF